MPRTYDNGTSPPRVVPERNPNIALRNLADFMDEYKDELGILAVWVEPDDDGYDELHYGLREDDDDGHLVLSMRNSCT